MSFCVRDSQGALVPVEDGVLHLEEARRYYLEKGDEGSEPRAWLGERELSWGANNEGAQIDVGQWIGTSTLRTSLGDRTIAVRVEVGPRREKLSDVMWLALLGDLEAWTAGLSAGLEGGSLGAMDTEGSSAPVAAIALLPLVPALTGAVHAVARAPREQATSFHESIPLRTVRRADRETLHWLSRTPGTARAVDRWIVAETGLLDPYVPQQITRDTIDHPVNRYVAWLIRRVADGLTKLSDALEREARSRSPSDTAEWCRARARAAARAAGDLSGTLRHTLFGKLSPSPPTEAALLAIQDDPVYARVHSLARPFLSPRYRLRDSLERGEVPAKASFELYELWTFLAVQRTLAARLEGWSWEWRSGNEPPLFAGIAGGARFSGKGPGGDELRIYYNLTFRGYLSRGSSDRYTLSGERRPDIVMTYRGPSGEVRWSFLDAKYRVSRPNLEDAFGSLHLYRDALRWEAFGGACRGGMLLVPAMDPACEAWFSEEFMSRFGIGVQRLTPGEPPTAEWESRLSSLAQG